jgi:PAS domain S-box-containing protein
MAHRKQVRLFHDVIRATNRLLTASDLTTGIPEALAILGEAAEVDRVYVFEHHVHPETGKEVFSQRFEWIRQGVEVEIHNPLTTHTSYNTQWYETLVAGKPIGGPVRHFPKAERHFLKPQGILSLLFAPVFANRKFWGFLGCDDYHRERKWSKDEEAALVAIAESIGTAIERQNVEEALRESEEKYRDLVENINDIIYVHDEHGRFVYISPVVEPLSGYTPAEIVGRFFTEFIHPEDLPALMESSQRTLAGHLEPSEFRVMTKSGEIRWGRSSSRPILQGGHVIGLRGVITDITERKQAEKRTVALLEVAKDISGTLDLDELLDRVQRRTATILPCDIVATFYRDPVREVFRMISQHGLPAELLPDAEALAFPPDKPFDGLLTIGRTVVINESVHQPWLPRELLAHFHITALMAAPLRVRDRHFGALVACTTMGGRRFDASQEELLHGIARQLAVGIEATELYRQQQQEAEISAALARVGQEMISSLDTPVILERLCQLTTEVLGCDFSHTALWQPDTEEFVVAATWGYSPEQTEALRVFKAPRKMLADLLIHLEEEQGVAMGAPLLPELMPEVLPQQFGRRAALYLALRRGRELIGLQSCGYVKPTDLTSRHLRIAHGISQIASMALANATLFTELQQANRFKDDFVSTMSHELRTPLNIIIGYNELLREETFGPLTAGPTDVLRRIDKAARELLDLITATLDLSRLQSQRVPLALKKVSMTELFAELEAESRQLCDKPTVGLTWQISPTLPSLHTDPVKLKMVLKNLITNALKFTDEGSVTILAHRQGEGVECCVRDTGIGIPCEALPIIFEPFRQVDSSPTRRHGGVGLGLYIVRQLLELLGGTVSVESELDKGSTFRVWIPIDARQ